MATLITVISATKTNLFQNKVDASDTNLNITEAEGVTAPEGYILAKKDKLKQSYVAITIDRDKIPLTIPTTIETTRQTVTIGVNGESLNFCEKKTFTFTADLLATINQSIATTFQNLGSATLPDEFYCNFLTTIANAEPSAFGVTNYISREDWQTNVLPFDDDYIALQPTEEEEEI